MNIAGVGECSNKEGKAEYMQCNQRKREEGASNWVDGSKYMREGSKMSLKMSKKPEVIRLFTIYQKSLYYTMSVYKHTFVLK